MKSQTKTSIQNFYKKPFKKVKFKQETETFPMQNVVAELNMEDFVVCYGMTETSPVTFQVKVTATVTFQVKKVTSTVNFKVKVTNRRIQSEQFCHFPGKSDQSCHFHCCLLRNDSDQFSHFPRKSDKFVVCYEMIRSYSVAFQVVLLLSKLTK